MQPQPYPSRSAVPPAGVAHQASGDQTTVPTLFFATAARLGATTALRRKRFGLWQAISWQEYAASVRALAGALLSWGLNEGEAVAILGENCPEWVISDIAIQAAGGIAAAIYATNAPDGVHYVLEHTEARFIVAENAEQLDKLLEVRGQLPKLERIIVTDWRGLDQFSDPMVLDFEQVLKDGAQWLNQHGQALETRLQQRQSHDPAIVIYTSGTTGRPKGALLSHRNLIFTAQAFGQANPIYQSDEALSFLPLSHVVERVLSVVYGAYYGITVSFAENSDTVLQNLREVRPTIFFAVPRVWEKLLSSIELRMNRADIIKRSAYQWALGLGKAKAKAILANTSAPAAADLAYATVLHAIKQKLGLDRTRVVLSGAAPIAPAVLEFFLALGVPIREGYGQTEGTAAATIHQGWPIRLGTVGKALPGIEVRLAEDGEILVRGENVFLGYFKDPAATAATLKDGWLLSGDVGSFDPDGELRITGRKKDLFITAAGKNIAPAYIENKLKASSYINDAILVGDGKHYLTALVIIDEENLSEWAQQHKIPFTTYQDLAQNIEVQKLIEREVELVNKTLARAETIKHFRILPKRLHQEDGEVTPTLKVKRQAILAQYAPLVAEMY
jgi:long-chain acyl-CoA synthetase